MSIAQQQKIKTQELETFGEEEMKNKNPIYTEGRRTDTVILNPVEKDENGKEDIKKFWESAGRASDYTITPRNRKYLLTPTPDMRKSKTFMNSQIENQPISQMIEEEEEEKEEISKIDQNANFTLIDLSPVQQVPTDEQPKNHDSSIFFKSIKTPDKINSESILHRQSRKEKENLITDEFTPNLKKARSKADQIQIPNISPYIPPNSNQSTPLRDSAPPSPNKTPLSNSPHKTPLSNSPHKTQLNNSPIKIQPIDSPNMTQSNNLQNQTQNAQTFNKPINESQKQNKSFFNKNSESNRSEMDESTHFESDFNDLYNSRKKFIQHNLNRNNNFFSSRLNQKPYEDDIPKYDMNLHPIELHSDSDQFENEESQFSFTPNFQNQSNKSFKYRNRPNIDDAAFETSSSDDDFYNSYHSNKEKYGNTKISVNINSNPINTDFEYRKRSKNYKNYFSNNSSKENITIQNRFNRINSAFMDKNDYFSNYKPNPISISSPKEENNSKNIKTFNNSDNNNNNNNNNNQNIRTRRSFSKLRENKYSSSSSDDDNLETTTTNTKTDPNTYANIYKRVGNPRPNKDDSFIESNPVTRISIDDKEDESEEEQSDQNNDHSPNYNNDNHKSDRRFFPNSHKNLPKNNNNSILRQKSAKRLHRNENNSKPTQQQRNNRNNSRAKNSSDYDYDSDEFSFTPPNDQNQLNEQEDKPDYQNTENNTQEQQTNQPQLHFELFNHNFPFNQQYPQQFIPQQQFGQQFPSQQQFSTQPQFGQQFLPQQQFPAQQQFGQQFLPQQQFPTHPQFGQQFQPQRQFGQQFPAQQQFSQQQFQPQQQFSQQENPPLDQQFPQPEQPPPEQQPPQQEQPPPQQEQPQPEQQFQQENLPPNTQQEQTKFNENDSNLGNETNTEDENQENKRREFKLERYSETQVSEAPEFKPSTPRSSRFKFTVLDSSPARDKYRPSNNRIQDSAQNSNSTQKISTTENYSKTATKRIPRGPGSIKSGIFSFDLEKTYQNTDDDENNQKGSSNNNDDDDQSDTSNQRIGSELLSLIKTPKSILKKRNENSGLNTENFNTPTKKLRFEKPEKGSKIPHLPISPAPDVNKPMTPLPAKTQHLEEESSDEILFQDTYIDPSILGEEEFMYEDEKSSFKTEYPFNPYTTPPRKKLTLAEIEQDSIKKVRHHHHRRHSQQDENQQREREEEEQRRILEEKAETERKMKQEEERLKKLEEEERLKREEEEERQKQIREKEEMLRQEEERIRIEKERLKIEEERLKQEEEKQKQTNQEQQQPEEEVSQQADQNVKKRRKRKHIEQPQNEEDNQTLTETTTETAQMSFEEMHNMSFPDYPSSSSSQPRANENQSSIIDISSFHHSNSPSPPPPQLPDNYDAEPPNLLSSTTSSSQISDNEEARNQQNEYQTESIEATSNKTTKNVRKTATAKRKSSSKLLFDPKMDDLPIALRRTMRPRTQPLRHWMNEKIIYKPAENGCFTQYAVQTDLQNSDYIDPLSPSSAETIENIIQESQRIRNEKSQKRNSSSLKNDSEVIPKRIIPGIENSSSSVISFKGLEKRTMKSNEVEILPEKTLELDASQKKIMVVFSGGDVAQIEYKNGKKWKIRAGGQAYICKGDSAMISNLSDEESVHLFIIYN